MIALPVGRVGLSGDAERRIGGRSLGPIRKAVHSQTASHGYIESFNAKLRDELLNGEVFSSVPEAKVLTDAWRRPYDHGRPHSLPGKQNVTHVASRWPLGWVGSCRRHAEASRGAWAQGYLLKPAPAGSRRSMARTVIVVVFQRRESSSQQISWRGVGHTSLLLRLR